MRGSRRRSSSSMLHELQESRQCHAGGLLGGSTHLISRQSLRSFTGSGLQKHPVRMEIPLARAASSSMSR